MEFGGKRWEGYDGFEGEVKQRFFDERHDTFEIHVTPDPEATHVYRTIFSTGMRAIGPKTARASKMIKTLIERDWEFRRDPATGGARIRSRGGTKVEYLPGFAPDDTADYDPHLDTGYWSAQDLTSRRRGGAVRKVAENQARFPTAQGSSPPRSGERKGPVAKQ